MRCISNELKEAFASVYIYYIVAQSVEHFVWRSVSHPVYNFVWAFVYIPVVDSV